MDWKNIIAEIQRLGQLTQPQIAEQVGCSQATISDLFTTKTQQPNYLLGAAIMGLFEKLKAEKQAA